MPHASHLIQPEPNPLRSHVTGASTLRSRLRRSALSVLVLFATMFTASFAHAQFRTSVQGVVTDPTGAVIPGATLTLKNNSTNETVARTSDPAGVFNFNALPSDTFTLTVDHPGFQEKVLTNLQFIPEQANSLTVQLSLAGTTQEVTVNASTVSSMDTETANIGGTITNNEIQHMPAFNLDVFTLTQLVPGVISDGSQGSGGGVYTTPGNQGVGGTTAGGTMPTENGVQANANGGQYETNSISIDGISTVSAVWGGSSVITPTEESVASVRVVSNDYDAENGRFSGAQTMVTSKTGTNVVHGSLFIAIHRPGLNAYQRYNGPGSETNPLNNQRDVNRFNTYGGSVGGPLWKNRVFAFFAYQASPNNSTSTGTGWYDTPAFDALGPAGSISSTYLTFPGAGVSNTGIIPQTCKDIGLTEGVQCNTVTGGLNIGSPLTTGLGTQDLGWTGSSNPGVGGGLSTVADIADYATSSPSSSTNTQYNGRLDADVTKKDHVAFAIYWIPQTSNSYNGSSRAYNLFHHTQINDAFSVIWNHTFSSNFLNEARANAAGWRYNELASNPQQPVGLPSDYIASAVGSAGLASFGPALGSDLNQWTNTYKDVATKILGEQTIKFGGEVTKLSYLNAPTGAPNYSFFNIWDFLNDAPEGEAGSFNPVTGSPNSNRQDDREDFFGFFVQDDWKVKPNLTINLGLRYSYFGALYDKQNTINPVEFGSGADFFTGLTVRQGGHLWTPQKGNFGPELGFAWTPAPFHDKLVVRGGWGLNYNQMEIALTQTGGQNPESAENYSFGYSNSATNISPDILYGVSSNLHSLDGFPSNPNTITSFNASNLPTAGNANLYGYQNNLPTSYTYHYSLDLQYDLGHQLVASLGYQGSSAHHVTTELPNLYSLGATTGLALNPLVTSINYWVNNGNSNNNSMLAEIKHQFAHQFSADAQFMWAKSMDDGSGPYEGNIYPYNASYNRARSDYNIGKSFKAFGVWQPVFFHGSHNWAEKVVGGWSLSGILNLHTGYGWTPTYSTLGALYCAGPSSNCGVFNLRPVYLGGAGHSTSNAAFKSGPGVGNGINSNFPNQVNATPQVAGQYSYSGSPYFAVADYSAAIAGTTAANTFPNVAAGLPPAPGIARNSFDGPGYRDVDASLSKAFGLPKMRVLGDNAKFEIRADAFNLFNNLNFNSGSIVNNITLTNFGQATSALGARTVSIQGRFDF